MDFQASASSFTRSSNSSARSRAIDEGLRLAPDDAELLNRRGVALLELGRPQEALDNFERVLAAAPDHLEALGNRGNALIKLNRAAEALSSYDKALTIAPDNAQLLTNRAAALRRLDRPHEAVMSARRALVSRPDFAQAKFVEGVARLTLGDFSGWRGYEARWGVGFLASHRRSFAAPLWLGEQSLDGKTILLHAEQGFGDTLQFVRYAPLFAGRGANVILEVQPELARLLSPLPGVAAVIARGKPLPRFDCHCPLMSLPLAFATELATIPAQIPYIAPADQDVALWRERLPRRRPLIGLVWSGERSHDNDRNRSLRLETLLPLLQTPDVTFVSLQHEVRDEDAGAPARTIGRRSRRRSVPRFRRYRRRGLAARRRDLGGHGGRAPRRRHGQTAFAVAAVRRRLPLAARARRQPVVSDRAAVSSAGIRRLGKRDRSAAARIDALHFVIREAGRVSMLRRSTA